MYYLHNIYCKFTTDKSELHEPVTYFIPSIFRCKREDLVSSAAGLSDLEIIHHTTHNSVACSSIAWRACCRKWQFNSVILQFQDCHLQTTTSWRLSARNPKPETVRLHQCSLECHTVKCINRTQDEIEAYDPRLIPLSQVEWQPHMNWSICITTITEGRRYEV